MSGMQRGLCAGDENEYSLGQRRGSGETGEVSSWNETRWCPSRRRWVFELAVLLVRLHHHLDLVETRSERARGPRSYCRLSLFCLSLGDCGEHDHGHRVHIVPASFSDSVLIQRHRRFHQRFRSYHSGRYRQRTRLPMTTHRTFVACGKYNKLEYSQYQQQIVGEVGSDTHSCSSSCPCLHCLSSPRSTPPDVA